MIGCNGVMCLIMRWAHFILEGLIIMQSIFGDINYKENEMMSCHTTFKIGGPAKYFFTPSTDEEIVQIINICRSNNIRYLIMGNGSNMLFCDE